MAADTGADGMKFPIGSLVVTPLGRIAKVLGEDDDGRLRLDYQDCDARNAPVSLLPKLLRAANAGDPCASEWISGL